MKFESRIPAWLWPLLVVAFAASLPGCSTTTIYDYTYTDASGKTVTGEYSSYCNGYSGYCTDSRDAIATLSYGATVSINSAQGEYVTPCVDSEKKKPENKNLSDSELTSRCKGMYTQLMKSIEEFNCIGSALGVFGVGGVDAAGKAKIKAVADNLADPINIKCVKQAENDISPTIQCPNSCDKNRLPVFRRNDPGFPVCGCPSSQTPPFCNNPAPAELDANGKPVWDVCIPVERTPAQLMNDPLLKQMMTPGCRWVYSLVTHSYVCQ